MTIRRPLSVMIAVTWLALATPVAADCDMIRSVDDALADGSIVFVGDVASLDGSDATFAVREVWSGDVRPSVTGRKPFGAETRGCPGRGAAGYAGGTAIRWHRHADRRVHRHLLVRVPSQIQLTR